MKYILPNSQALTIAGRHVIERNDRDLAFRYFKAFSQTSSLSMFLVCINMPSKRKLLGEEGRNRPPAQYRLPY